MEEKEKRAPGRPKKSDLAKKNVSKMTRWTWGQWREVEAAAARAGMTESAFIRACVLSQAAGINEKTRKISSLS